MIKKAIGVAAVVVSLALAACTSTGVSGRWSSDDGMYIELLDGGRFVANVYTGDPGTGGECQQQLTKVEGTWVMGDPNYPLVSLQFVEPGYGDQVHHVQIGDVVDGEFVVALGQTEFSWDALAEYKCARLVVLTRE